MAKGVALETSHGRARPTLRIDEATPATAPEAPTLHAPEGTRSAPNNPGRPFADGDAARRAQLLSARARSAQARQLRGRAHGIASLNPERVPTWMRPFVSVGATYVASLLRLLDGQDHLHALAGDCADAHCVFRATLQLAFDAPDAASRAKLMSEARGWLREHRTAVATLSALAGGMALPRPDDPNEIPVGFEPDDGDST